MPVPRYGLSIGTVKRIDEDRDSSPHYRIFFDPAHGLGEQKAAVNMASVLDPPNLLTRLEGPKVADIPQHDHHPVTLSIINRLQKLESGLYEGPAGLEKAQFPDGIDFVHGHRQDGFGFTPDDFHPEPAFGTGGLFDAMADMIELAKATPGARVFFFGSMFPNSGDATGIHDIHMNQGNRGKFRKDNGVGTDGAMFVHVPAGEGREEQWWAFYTAFQSQDWNTDPNTGQPRDDAALMARFRDTRPDHPEAAALSSLASRVAAGVDESGRPLSRAEHARHDATFMAELARATSRYALSVGKLQVVDDTSDRRRTPHLNLLFNAGSRFGRQRAAINMESRLKPSDLLVRVEGDGHASVSPVTQDIINTLEGVETGVYEGREAMASKGFPDGIDYQRTDREGGLGFSKDMFDVVDDDRLFDVLGGICKRAKAAGGTVYFFGETFGSPSGIHDIHMNQGSRGRFSSSNGVGTDGAMFVRIPRSGSSPQWFAFFSAFQSQAWDTHDETGHPRHDRALRSTLATLEPSHPLRAEARALASGVDTDGRAVAPAMLARREARFMEELERAEDRFMLSCGAVTTVDDTSDRVDKPHLLVDFQAGAAGKLRASINMESNQRPHDLLVRLEGPDHASISPTTQQVIDVLAKLESGSVMGSNNVKALGFPNGIDYILGDGVGHFGFTQDQFTAQTDDTLFEILAPLLRQEGAVAYFFGGAFSNGGGLHLIHMNQGSRGRYRRYNRPQQDGAMFVRVPSEEGDGTSRWWAFFSAFASQSWNNHRRSGHPRRDAHLRMALRAMPPSEPDTRRLRGLARVVDAGVDKDGTPLSKPEVARRDAELMTELARAVDKYSISTGTITGTDDSDRDSSPHFKVFFEAGDEGKQTAAVNMASRLNPPDLLVRFEGPQLGRLPGHELSEGTRQVVEQLGRLNPGVIQGSNNVSEAVGQGLDYQRQLNFNKSMFTTVDDDHLFDAMKALFSTAASVEGARVYFFGQVFGGRRTTGIHDIHMNQGNRGRFARDNGVGKDGAMFVSVPSSDAGDTQWYAFYSAFQSQSWGDENVHARTGHPTRRALFAARAPRAEAAVAPAGGAEESKGEDTTAAGAPAAQQPDGGAHTGAAGAAGAAATTVAPGDVGTLVQSVESQLRERAAQTLSNMQRGLVYAAPYNGFAMFGAGGCVGSLTKTELGAVVQTVRNFIHERHPSTHTSASVGVSFAAWKAWAGDAVPTGMALKHPVEGNPNKPDAFVNGSHVYSDTGAALFFHLKSSADGVVQSVFTEVARALGEYGVEVVRDPVFTHSRGDDMVRVTDADAPHGEREERVGRVLGCRFAENLENPTSPVEVLDHTLVNREEPNPMHHGGAFVVAQRFIVNWDLLHSMGDDTIEDVLGRKAKTDEFIPSRSHDSHVKCSHVADDSGDTVRLLRLGQPFGTSPRATNPDCMPLGHTLADEEVFVGVAASAANIEQILRSQVGNRPGFVRDRLLQCGVSANMGGLFYLPSRADLGLHADDTVADFVRGTWGRDGGVTTSEWSRFPGVDWTRLPRHYLQPSGPTNPWMMYNHHQHLFRMSTATGAEALTLQPPSVRVLTLASRVFARWQDSWYRGRLQQRMAPLRTYLTAFFTAHPASDGTSVEAQVDAIMASDVVTRKAWAVRLAAGHVFPSDAYGRRGLLNKAEMEADPSVPAKYGADTYHMHDLELLVGGMPNLSLGQGKFLIDYATEEEAWGNFRSTISYASGVGHVVPHYDDILQHGVQSVVEKVAALAEEHPDKATFYNASVIALHGVMENCQAFARLAAEHLETAIEGSPEAINLAQVRDMMTHLGEGKAPRDLREGAQMVFTMHSCLHLIGEPVAIGRLDQLLARFMPEHPSASDLRAAQDVIDAFFLKLADKTIFNRQFFVDHQPPGHLAMGNRSGPYPQGASLNQWVQQLTVGGVDEQNNPVFNWLTVLCLRASRRLPLNAPVLSLRLFATARMPDQWREVVLHEAAMALLSGGAHPVLLNDDKIIDGLCQSAVRTRTGGDAPVVPREHARNYACDGCYEPMFVGRNWFMLGGFPTLVPLEYALNQGRSMLSAGPTFLQGKVESFRSPPASEIATFDDLLDLFYRHFQWKYAVQAEGFVANFGAVSKSCPAPLLSTVILGCMERGRDMYSGGPEYSVVGPCFTSLANTIDALWAIKALCFDPDTAVTSLPELVTCLQCDWGHNMTDPQFQPEIGDVRLAANADRFKYLRRQALALPRFGRGHAAIDKFGNDVCAKVAALSLELFQDAPAPFTGLADRMRTLADKPALEGMGEVCFQPGIGTFAGYVSNGLNCAASADGRRKGSPLGTDLSPAPSRSDAPPQPAKNKADILKAMHGMSASSTIFWNGAPVDKNVDEAFPLHDMVEVVRAFADGVGSNIMTITTANIETFEAAKATPERYDCVRIRTGGWTEFYACMAKAHKNVHLRRPRDVPAGTAGCPVHHA